MAFKSLVSPGMIRLVIGEMEWSKYEILGNVIVIWRLALMLEKMNRNWWVVGTIAVTIPVLVLLFSFYPTDVFFTNHYDDSYITYRYAINWAKGNGLVFNIGDRTDAASSFVYAALLAAAYKVGFENLEIVSILVSFLSLGLVLALTFALAYRFTSNPLVSALTTILLGLNGFFSGWVFSGMETIFWSATVMISLFLMISRSKDFWIILSIILACLTRFEGILLIGCYGLYLMTNFADSRDQSLLSVFRTSNQIPFIKTHKKQLGSVALVGLGLVLFYWIKYQYYGVWISHALLMKKYANYYLPAPLEMLKHWIYFGSAALLLALPGFLNRRNHYLMIFWLVSFAVVAFGPRSDWGRYSIHMLPLVSVFAAIGLTTLLKRSRLALIAGALVLGAQSSLGFYYNHRNMRNLGAHQICRRELGTYIASHLKDEKYIASSDIGMIAYSAMNNSFVDVVGLTSKKVIESYLEGKNINDLLRSQEVKYFADTFERPGRNRFDSVQAGFKIIKEEPEFYSDAINPSYVFKCSLDFSPANLFFAVAPIIEKRQAGDGP